MKGGFIHAEKPEVEDPEIKFQLMKGTFLILF